MPSWLKTDANSPLGRGAGRAQKQTAGSGVAGRTHTHTDAPAHQGAPTAPQSPPRRLGEQPHFRSWSVGDRQRAALLPTSFREEAQLRATGHRGTTAQTTRGDAGPACLRNSARTVPWVFPVGREGLGRLQVPARKAEPFQGAARRTRQHRWAADRPSVQADLPPSNSTKAHRGKSPPPLPPPSSNPGLGPSSHQARGPSLRSGWFSRGPACPPQP